MTHDLTFKCSIRWYAKPVLFIFAMWCIVTHRDATVPPSLAKWLIKAELVENKHAN